MAAIPETVIKAYLKGSEARLRDYKDGDEEVSQNPYVSFNAQNSDEYYAWGNGRLYAEQFLKLCVPHMDYNK